MLLHFSLRLKTFLVNPMHAQKITTNKKESKLGMKEDLAHNKISASEY